MIARYLRGLQEHAPGLRADVCSFLCDTTALPSLRDMLRPTRKDEAIAIESESTRVRSATVSVPNASNGGDFVFSTYVFARARKGNQQMCWAASDVYKFFFAMTTYQGSSSVWASRQRETWCRMWLESYGAELFVVGTTVTGRNASNSAAVAFADRCLPNPSLATLGLLDLLTKWSCDGAKDALKRVPNSSNNASTLLTCLAKRAQCEQGGRSSWNLVLVLEPNWKPKHPQRDAVENGHGVVSLPVSDDLMVDVAPLEPSATVFCLAQDALAVLRNACGRATTSAEFLQLLFVWHQASTTRSLARQMLFRLSLRLERLFGGTRPEDKYDVRLATFAWMSQDDNMPIQRAPYFCAANVADCRQQLAMPEDMAILTDKGYAHGLPLQVTIFCCPNGYAALAPPQVVEKKRVVAVMSAWVLSHACCLPRVGPSPVANHSWNLFGV